MRERLLAWMQGQNRWIAIGVASLVLLGLSLVILLRQDSYSLLYDNLSPEDSRAVTLLLTRQNIPYREAVEGARIMVASRQVGEARILVAEEGLPRAASLGYELFDREQGLSTSSFVQEINRVRALEGELARTIVSVEGIANARVHIVLPKRELFSRDKQTASASIIVTTRPGQSLERRKIRAIQNLVAAAVPDLTSEGVAITDAQGNLLARSGEEGQNIFGSTPDEIRSAYESRLAQQLQSLVGSVVGISNVRVESSVELDFGQTVVNEEIFDADGQVLRSSEEINEETRSATPSDRQVSVDTNLPDAQLRELALAAGAREESTRSEIRRNYDITKRLVNRVVAPGQVSKISVAVLVDGTYENLDSGETRYSPRSEEELLQIERLVRSAIGYDQATRQDNVEVVNMRFFEDVAPSPDDQASLWGLRGRELGDLIEKTVLAGIFLIAFLAVIGPLMLRLLAAQREEQALRRTRAEAEITRQQRGISAGMPLSAEEIEETMDIDGIESKIKSSLVTKLNDVISRYPDETFAVLRGWLAE